MIYSMKKKVVVVVVVMRRRTSVRLGKVFKENMQVSPTESLFYYELK